MSEPKRRKDGLCRCGCGKPVPTTLGKSLKSGGRSFAHEHLLRTMLRVEPFATTECAKKYFGVVTSGGSGGALYGKGVNQLGKPRK